jgi:hypothetical protein
MKKMPVNVENFFKFPGTMDFTVYGFSMVLGKLPKKFRPKKHVTLENFLCNHLTK